MHLIKAENGLYRQATMGDMEASDTFLEVIPTDDKGAAQFVIAYLERETELPFGYFIGQRERNRIARLAGYDPNATGFLSSDPAESE